VACDICRRCCSIPSCQTLVGLSQLLWAFCWGFRGADPLGCGTGEVCWWWLGADLGRATLLWTFGFDTCVRPLGRFGAEDARLGLAQQFCASFGCCGPAVVAICYGLRACSLALAACCRVVVWPFWPLWALAAIVMQHRPGLLRGQPATGLFRPPIPRQVQLGLGLLGALLLWTAA